ncbi:hypothetical protein AX16_007943 [Volvariella volvacea WC 439]|nr:hypothetical protein AX16_007943 [Volvariella volvacea WC 439]
MSGILNKIHSTPASAMPKLLDSVRPILQSCKETTAALASLIPPNQHWRYRDMWTAPLRSAVSSIAMIEYLSHRTLISVAGIEEVLGIDETWKDRFGIPVEDYLHGIISLVNELSRLAVNAVTLANFEEPLKISVFVKDLFAGFSMLNLKNDQLRRRFDSLKYDIKKVEEVVYDVSLRKLVPTPTEIEGE